MFKQSSDKKVGLIYKTNNYDKFGFLPGNRRINMKNVNNLRRSMKEKQLEVPIVVDENFIIYDGQNRFEAIKSLQLPVYYQIINDMDLRCVQLLNANVSNWTTADYCNSYIEFGNENYKIYKDFKKKYQFGVRETINMLSGLPMNTNNEQDFKDGKFKCTYYKDAVKKADMIVMLRPYVVFYKKRIFISAMFDLFKNSKYSHNRFMRKIKIKSQELHEHSKKNDMLANIEKIYNWKEKTKVRLFTY